MQRSRLQHCSLRNSHRDPTPLKSLGSGCRLFTHQPILIKHMAFLKAESNSSSMEGKNAHPEVNTIRFSKELSPLRTTPT